MQVSFLFSIVILLLSVALHEASHGYAADKMGDPTARMAGRLTLNPIKHLDLVGSIFVPLITFFVGGVIFGWAKPVPYNPYNLQDQKWGEAKVAFAGPASNLSIAIIFGLFIRFGVVPSDLLLPVSLIVLINLVLAIFNLIPIPPLDGSKILFSLLPYKHINIRHFLERYSLALVFVFVFFLWRLLLPIVGFFFSLITGILL